MTNSFDLMPVRELTTIAKSSSKYPVDFEEAWQWIGYSRKDAALRALQENFEEGQDYSSLHVKVEREIGATQRRQVKLTVDCFKSFCMMAGTEKGKAVRKYYLNLERQYFTQDIRKKSVDNRNAFTAGCKRQGLSQPQEYAAVTKSEYRSLFSDPDLRKAEMSRDQILALSALEAVEAFKYSRLPEDTLKLPGIVQSGESTAQMLETAATEQARLIGAQR